MSDSEVYDRLREPFEEAAYSADNSRGFELTSIKAAYIFERLNEVFGLCGQGWRYAHSPFEEIDNEVCTEIALQHFSGDGEGPVEWDNMIGHWRSVEGNDWSAPIFSPGGKQIIKGRRTDARKSAVTDGITKAASMIGVGSDVFKGLVRVGNRPAQRPTQPSPQAESARERAKTSAKTSAKTTAKTDGKTDGTWVRPAPPKKLRDMLQERISTGKQDKTTAGQAKYVAQLFGEVFAGDIDGDEEYHDCLEYLTGVRSATDLTKVGASALIKNLREEPESKENYNLHPKAVEEMQAVLSEVRGEI